MILVNAKRGIECTECSATASKLKQFRIWISVLGIICCSVDHRLFLWLHKALSAWYGIRLRHHLLNFHKSYVSVSNSRNWFIRILCMWYERAFFFVVSSILHYLFLKLADRPLLYKLTEDFWSPSRNFTQTERLWNFFFFFLSFFFVGGGGVV